MGSDATMELDRGTVIDGRFRRNPAHRALFMQILRSPSRVTRELRRMNQYGVLGRYLKPFGRMDAYPNIKAWVKRFQARPAYKAALEKGGAYSYGSA